MQTKIQKLIHSKLRADGLEKLPRAVIASLEEGINEDMNLALAKSLRKRTTPKAIARLFAECVMGKLGGDSKGVGNPFGQLCPANVSETRTLIGTHSNTKDELLDGEIK